MLSHPGFVYHPLDELAVCFLDVDELTTGNEAALHVTHAVFDLALVLGRPNPARDAPGTHSDGPGECKARSRSGSQGRLSRPRPCHHEAIARPLLAAHAVPNLADPAEVHLGLATGRSLHANTHVPKAFGTPPPHEPLHGRIAAPVAVLSHKPTVDSSHLHLGLHERFHNRPVRLHRRDDHRSRRWRPKHAKKLFGLGNPAPRVKISLLPSKIVIVPERCGESAPSPWQSPAPTDHGAGDTRCHG